MKVNRYALSFLAALIAVACVKSAPRILSSPAPANAFTERHPGFDSATVKSLSSLRTLSTDDATGSVSLVGYALQSNRVMAVYSESGSVIGWDLDTNDVVATYELGIISTKALSFSASAYLLMGATEHIFKPNYHGKVTEYVNGIVLWNMRSGQIEKCITVPCQGNTSDGDGIVDAGIDPSGRWVYTVTETTVGLSDLSGETPGRITVVNDLDSPNQWYVGTIALDAAHSRYAIAFLEGGILLSKQNFEPSYRTLVEGTAGDSKPITTAKFDRTGQRFAIIRGDYLSVWQVDSGDMLFQQAVSHAVSLSFDQSGHFLFVAANNSITVWDVDSQSDIAEYAAPDITCLDVSEDNRLLIWGDANGAVRLFAASSP